MLTQVDNIDSLSVLKRCTVVHMSRQRKEASQIPLTWLQPPTGLKIAFSTRGTNTQGAV